MPGPKIEHQLIVTVHLHTTLQRHTPDGIIDRLEVALPPGSLMADLLAQLDIKLSSDNLLLVVNGRIMDLDHPLADNDRVNLMPAMSGG